jgi:transcriptional regulator with XRE-family HTH domain
MFRNRIDYWIKVRGLKQKFIASQVEVSYQTVSNWRNNRSQPDLKQSYILSRLLNVTLNDLVEEYEEE